MSTRIPLSEKDGFIICFEAEPEYMDMEQHFRKECKWSKKQYEAIEDFAWFSAKVSAWKDGKELGAAYLGGCCYETVQEFLDTDGGGYLPQMIEEALDEAKGATK